MRLRDTKENRIPLGQIQPEIRKEIRKHGKEKKFSEKQNFCSPQENQPFNGFCDSHKLESETSQCYTTTTATSTVSQQPHASLASLDFILKEKGKFFRIKS